MPLRVIPSDRGIKPADIAPCGMNCRLCYAAMRAKAPCPGCRGDDQNKPASCVFCRIRNCRTFEKKSTKYCFSCETFPCLRLKRLDKRYRTKYGMSMIENLIAVRESGVREFVRSEKARWACPSCGTILCVHRADCAKCGHARRS